MGKDIVSKDDVSKDIVSKDEDDEVLAFVPIQREMHEWPSNGKRVIVDRVIYPCYVFIRCSDRDRYYIACQAKFILHFMMDMARITKDGRSDFARIPKSQMDNFRKMVGNAERPVSIDFLGSARTEHPIELLELVED